MSLYILHVHVLCRPLFKFVCMCRCVYIAYVGSNIMSSLCVAVGWSDSSVDGTDPVMDLSADGSDPVMDLSADGTDPVMDLSADGTQGSADGPEPPDQCSG